uniref:Putative capsid protein n=1 Tax=viral metagenome TaxID=1070528 RepID=A0A6M3JCB4_9ZZZZ
MAEATAKEFRVGHQVLLRDASDYTVDVNAKVTARELNGASSYIAAKLLEADDNSTTHDLRNCDVALIIGNINAEGAAMPDALAYDPTKWYNYTQIFRTPLEITRTARRTRLRTGDQYREAKREALELHSIEMEKAFIWGIATEGTGDNGKPERTTMGILGMLKASAAANCVDYSLDSDYAGEKWVVSGKKWFDKKLEVIFRYGNAEKLALAGSGALLGLNELAESLSTMNISPGETSYGIKITKWMTAFGVINIMTHPLFSYEATNRNSIVILEPKNLKYRYIDDTSFYSEKEKQNTGWTRRDGTKEEFLTECGLEYHHPTTMGYFNSVGIDNTLV